MRHSFKDQLSSHEALATLAGGCFWGVEDLLRKTPGVLRTQVGYTGGQTLAPNYDQVKTGETGHAEAIEVVFDSSQLEYEALLELFFKIHDPTTLNQQGNDIGSQYRSEIFVHTPEQRSTAQHILQKVQNSDAWKRPIVTRITDATSFWPAEEFHQDYLEKNPGGYTCHFERKIRF